jgi:hypothetical protein
MNKLIALVGTAGSGKSLVGKRLVERHGFAVLRIADPIKRMLSAGLGLTEEQLDGRSKQLPIPEFGGHTPRHLMQTLGFGWGRREVHANLWVEVWRQNYRKMAGPVVVDDVRFTNEAAVVRELGGVVWRITRPGVGGETASDRAISEIEADLVIENRATVPELLLEVDKAIAELLTCARISKSA